MENNNENLQEQESLGQEPIFLREKESNNHNLWYILIAILLLGLLGWYGYTAGWFSANKTITTDTEKITSAGELMLNNDAENKIFAPISNVSITTKESFPVQKTLVLRGDLPNGCTYLNEPQVIRDGSTFYVSLTTRVEGDVCTQALVPYERNIELDVVGLPAGTYIVVINGKEISFELESDNAIDFSGQTEK